MTFNAHVAASRVLTCHVFSRDMYYVVYTFAEWLGHRTRIDQKDVFCIGLHTFRTYICSRTRETPIRTFVRRCTIIENIRDIYSTVFFSASQSAVRLLSRLHSGHWMNIGISPLRPLDRRIDGRRKFAPRVRQTEIRHPESGSLRCIACGLARDFRPRDDTCIFFSFAVSRKFIAARESSNHSSWHINSRATIILMALPCEGKVMNRLILPITN